MKQSIRILGSVAIIGLLLVVTSCATTDLTTNRTGWSDYATIAIKDYTSLDHVRVTATETTTVGFLGLTSSTIGSKVTYDMLLAEAKKLGADDIINVRIDVQNRSTRNLILDRIIGYTATVDYIGNALAIKYTSAQPDFRADGESGDAGILRETNALTGLKSVLDF